MTVSITGSYLLNITITSPPVGAEIQDDNTAVGGTYAAYTSNLSIYVNGIAASFSGGIFSVSNVPLHWDTNTLPATITTVDGISDISAWMLPIVWASSVCERPRVLRTRAKRCPKVSFPRFSGTRFRRASASCARSPSGNAPTR